MSAMMVEYHTNYVIKAGARQAKMAQGCTTHPRSPTPQKLVRFRAVREPPQKERLMRSYGKG
ncbi:MAG: hypothetical protein Kow0099_20350 [Candidatus Abyssubacteria bacterium]